MVETTEIISMLGEKKGVKISKDKYEITLYTTRNGYQWHGFPVDIKMLKLIKEVIDKFLEKENKNER